MAFSASALPALPPNVGDAKDGIRKIVERLNVLIRWFNRPDLFVPSYAADMGSGTAYVTTPSADVKVYEVGQEFDFKATNANTSTAPTLAVQGLTAGTITLAGGGVVPLGAIAANGFYKVIVTSTTPTFQLLSPIAAFSSVGAQTFLGADLALNNTATVFNGPNTGSIGANGQTWNIEVSASCFNSGGTGTFDIGVHDGTNYLVATRALTAAINIRNQITISVIVTLTAATTFTMKCQDTVSTNSTIATSAGSPFSLANHASYIKAVRLA